MHGAKIRGVAQPGLARLLGVQEVAGSNPVAPTDLRQIDCTDNGLAIRASGQKNEPASLSVSLPSSVRFHHGRFQRFQ
jgi:hypothetical protein